MGALDRIKREKNTGKMMIPANVSGTNYIEGASTKQGVSFALLIALWVIVMMMFTDSKAAETFTGWAIVLGALLLVSQFVVRFLIIDEKYLMKQTELIENSRDKVPSDLWDVINIDDEGVIYYQDGRVSVIIEAEQATVIGRNEQFKAQHYSAISDFYKILNQNKVSWTHHNAMISARAENRLLNVGEELKKRCNSNSIKKMCEQHLNYLRTKEVKTLYEREYWALIVSPSVGRDKLLAVAQQAAARLEGAAFNHCSIITKDQCYHVNTELLALDSFNASALMIQKAQKIVNRPIAKITQLKLKTGELSDKMATFAKTKFKQLNDKTELLETISGITTVNIGNTFGNTINARLQLYKNNKRTLNEGEVWSSILGIKIVEGQSGNSQNKNKSVNSTPANNSVQLAEPAELFNTILDTVETKTETELAVANKKEKSSTNKGQVKNKEQLRIEKEQEQARLQQEQAQKEKELNNSLNVDFDDFK